MTCGVTVTTRVTNANPTITQNGNFIKYTSSDPPKKSHLSLFAFRINRFWEKALDIQTFKGTFGLKYFP